MRRGRSGNRGGKSAPSVTSVESGSTQDPLERLDQPVAVMFAPSMPVGTLVGLSGHPQPRAVGDEAAGDEAPQGNEQPAREGDDADAAHAAPPRAETLVEPLT
jgi:hypothetical protein